ncbi:MAG TPA: hypothetical protein VMV93_10825 [Chloroflexota bacterium]|nr:hypothetical protein [Chloroflexota bacterium]
MVAAELAEPLALAAWVLADALAGAEASGDVDEASAGLLAADAAREATLALGEAEIGALAAGGALAPELQLATARISSSEPPTIPDTRRKLPEGTPPKPTAHHWPARALP